MAFAAVVVSNFDASGDATTFVWERRDRVTHPAGFTPEIAGTTAFDVDAAPAQVLAQVCDGVRDVAAGLLQGAGHDVPAERIAVVVR